MKMKRKRVLPKGWKEITIGEVFKTGSGGTPLSTNKEYYEGGTIPWINSGELNQNYIDKTDNYISDLGLNNSSAKVFPKGTVLIAMYGATAGKTSLLNIDACTNQAICAILENPDYSNLFLKYNLENLYEYLVNTSSGSARDNLSQEGIAKLSLYFPKERELQEKLINVLKIIDQKIILNTRMNAELEAMAKQLYDYWFVQFDFPDENGNPYKSSGGKMVYSPTLKREIPAGWEVRGVKHFADIFTGKKDVSKVTPGDYLFFSCAPNPISSNEFIYDGEIVLVSGNGSYTGRVSYYNGKCDLYQRTYGCILRNGFKDYYPWFYSYMKFYFQPLYTGGKHGSAIPYIVYSDLADSIIVSNEKIIAEFSNKIRSIFNYRFLVQQKENDKLTHLRNSLLPMLMNGQVTVE